MDRKERPTKGGRKRRQAEVAETNADLLRHALDWFSDGCDFSGLRLHGNVGWLPVHVVTLAVLWAWSDRARLTDAFSDARKLATQMFGALVLTTYQGLMGALRAYSEQLLPLVWARMQTLMEKAGGEHWRIGPWLALAVDGSRVTTPRTQSNEQAFSARNYGQGKKAKSRKKWKNKKRRSKRLSEPVKPQIWLTLIWHMGLKLPWCWRTGPSTASERDHLLEMLTTLAFPKKTLFCADAGFVGYALWTAILDQKQNFLIRVGANIRLLKNLGTAREKGDLVYLWPNEAARKKQLPLTLRLLEFQGPRGKVYLVTNVLSNRELTLRQASQLYRLRWGVELQFRTFKQTFGRSKLRCRTSDNAVVELHWSLVGLSLVQLFAVKEQIEIGSPPQQSSVALALSVLQGALRNWNGKTDDPSSLVDGLRAAIKDDYERSGSKQARYRPHNKDAPSAKQPVVISATLKQRRAYQALANAA